VANVSKKDIIFFQEHGYLLAPSVLSQRNDFSPIESEYHTLLKDKFTRPSGDVNHDINESDFLSALLTLCKQTNFDLSSMREFDITLPHYPFSRININSTVNLGAAVFSFLTSKKITSCIEKLIGQHITASPNQHCRLKLPSKYFDINKLRNTNAETVCGLTPWHQDIQAQAENSDNIPHITTWIPMQDVDEENGCLLVAPKMHHRCGVLSIPTPTEMIKILDEKAIPIKMKKGDVLFMDKRLPHAALPNLSDNIRWSFDFRYYPTNEKSDRPWFPSLKISDPFNADYKPNHAEWVESWNEVRRIFANSQQLVPGRREFSQLIAGSIIDDWENTWM